MEKNIRRATENDIGKISELLVQVCGVHADIRPDIFENGGAKYTAEELAGIINCESSPVFVCECDGAVCGYAFLRIMKEGGGARRSLTTLYLDDLCVDSNMRKSGVGSALFEYVRQFAKDIGAHNLTLHVYEGNDAAISFYRSHGMKTQYYALEEIINP